MSTIEARRPLTVVEHAATLAKPLNLNKRSLEKEQDALRGTLRHLLPIEARSRERVEKRVDELTQLLRWSEIDYPQLDLSVLDWRWANGLPKLALMALDGPSFTISARRQSNGSAFSNIEPDLKKVYASHYQDVMDLASSFCWRTNSWRSYTFTFDGAIPAKTRAKIAEALPRFGRMYLLCEAPEEAWKVEYNKGWTRRKRMIEAAKNIQIDPLVVGASYDALWVVDQFDLTTIEQYVLDEFSAKALLPGS